MGPGAGAPLGLSVVLAASGRSCTPFGCRSTLLFASIPTAPFCSQPVSFACLTTCLVAVGIAALLPGEAASREPAPNGCWGATRGWMSWWKVLAAFCSLTSSRQSPGAPPHNPAPSGTVRPLCISRRSVSRRPGQESCPGITFLSPPPPDSRGTMAGINPHRQSLKSILSQLGEMRLMA